MTKGLWPRLALRALVISHSILDGNCICSCCFSCSSSSSYSESSIELSNEVSSYTTSEEYSDSEARRWIANSSSDSSEDQLFEAWILRIHRCQKDPLLAGLDPSTGVYNDLLDYMWMRSKYEVAIFTNHDIPYLSGTYDDCICHIGDTLRDILYHVPAIKSHSNSKCTTNLKPIQRLFLDYDRFVSCVEQVCSKQEYIQNYDGRYIKVQGCREPDGEWKANDEYISRFYKASDYQILENIVIYLNAISEEYYDM